MKNKYNCQVCKEEWEFVPEDYENPWDYPEVCPLCSMPIVQMIQDVYKEDGIMEVLRFIWLRIKDRIRC